MGSCEILMDAPSHKIQSRECAQWNGKGTGGYRFDCARVDFAARADPVAISSVTRASRANLELSS